MSFIADKKREHEAIAEKELLERNYAKAWFHAAKAAEFGLVLAEQSEGKIARSYVDDAFELLAIAEELKAKAGKQVPAAAGGSITGVPSANGSGRPAVKETGTEDEATQSQWQLKGKPTEKLADVAGLDVVKVELREKVIEPFLHPEAYEKFKVRIGGGIMMYGPPGNGKTFIAKAIAGELDAAFFNVNASQIKDKYVGETEKNIQKLFDEAREHPKAVLFFDEVDHLLAKRGNRKIGSVAQFLTQVDGLVKNTNCLLVLAATNKPWTLDEAAIRPGRLGTHIYVGPPDAPARKAMLEYNLKGVPLAQAFGWDDIVAQTENYSGADVAEVCDRAKRAALKRQLSGDSASVVGPADFKEALERVKPSVTAAMLKEFELWRDKRASPGGSAEDDGD